MRQPWKILHRNDMIRFALVPAIAGSSLVGIVAGASASSTPGARLRTRNAICLCGAFIAFVASH